MYLNIKVFSLTQTYTGFKILESNYKTAKAKNKEKLPENKDEDLGYYYKKLVEKF